MPILPQSSRPRRRRGNVVVLMSLSLVALIGVVAITMDGGLLQDRRRHIQASADAAALAAATDLFEHYPVNQGQDTSSDGAKNSALAVAAANGYNDDGTTNTVTVSIPPATGPFAGKKGYAEVTIQYNQKRYFSTIFGSDDLPVVARAVARGTWADGKNGIMVLDLASKGALNAHGNGSVYVNGAPVIVNSRDAAAAIGNGSNAILGAPRFDIVGNYDTTGGAQFIGQINTGTTPEPDPLRYMPPPAPGSLPLGGSSFDNLGSGNKLYHLTPGRFPGGLSFSSKDSVEMAPGIYYMDGGGFSFSGQSGTTLSGSGVMIYNAPTSNSQRIDITGQGQVSLSPMTTGPYQGIAIWQDRSSDVPVNITGNGQFDVRGTIYAANAPMYISGNGDVSLGSQHISRTLDLGGNGNYTITWNANQVAKVRVIQLVE